MTIQFMSATFTGTRPLLLGNPQSVDPFNVYSKQMKKITNKRGGRTEDDLLELQRIEVASKLYFDDEIGVYVPATWVSSAIAQNSFSKTKIKKADIRGGVFMADDKLKLYYDGMDKVKTAGDVIGKRDFYHRMILKQGQVRVAKCMPIFHKWKFVCDIEFDDVIIDRESIEYILKYCAAYGGFGDFRPTFGRASVEFA